MATTITINCELPSVKYYRELYNAEKTTSYSYCDSDENINLGKNEISVKKLLSQYDDLKDFCYKLEANLQSLKNTKNPSDDVKKRCTHLQLLLQDKVINTVESKSMMLYITLFYKIWENIMDNAEIKKNNECNTNHYPVRLDYYTKWKKLYDYILNYKKVQSALLNNPDFSEECNEECKKNCKEDYCAYILDIFNIYEEFKHVCNGINKQSCPIFWKDFQDIYSINSETELVCKDVYDKRGNYKVKMYWGEQGIEEYIEQYESEHIFSFFEKLIGYSIKYYLSKTIHYSKYILLPILSFFGSKIAPKADDMRKMWRNVQGVTNPASLLNPMKPPGGGNKIALSYLPK
ncbi:PIR Superfamily Protein [Plasmodium ovale curtisi]|uniref:PIR Superfamily Protein n=1 Tax=Plasmodium ovale curtisi TaxID=864141 RepID=A0A1A8X6T8_PLAOA|nr:PIR Superfamily Protein [Plasmodium ovale curtisi]SBT00966.1 PIR Superfamily Protein [Plasmodium ovale curtisi]